MVTADALTADRVRELPGPEWLRALRVDAAERFGAASLPDQTREEWRYSRVGDIDLSRFIPVASGAVQGAESGEPSGAAETISAGLGPYAGRVVHHNGVVIAIDVAPEWADRGVTVGRLTDLAAAPATLTEQSAPVVGDPFTDLNVAFSADPVVIDVPRNVVVDEPFQIIGLIEGHDVLALPRLIVTAGENSEFAIVEWLTSDASESLVVPRTSIHVGGAARVSHVAVNNLGAGTQQLGAISAAVDRDATLRSAYVGLGGSYARSRIDCRLVGPGASAKLSALYLGGGDQMHDLRTFQTHEAPDTTSDLLFKGALDDRAHAVYTGMIRVDHEARGTNANQTNRNIMLSEDAWAESVPNLEINHNDVRCAHASAIGPIDEDQRFYLESRGVPPEVAERLVVNGFFEEVLDALPVSGVAAMVRPLVAARLTTS